MNKLVEAQYVERHQVAVWLARLIYPIAVTIEEARPATTLKLLEAVYQARHTLYEFISPMHFKNPERKVKRAIRALECVAAVLKGILAEDREADKHWDGPMRKPKLENGRITAAIEVTERLIGMLKTNVD